MMRTSSSAKGRTAAQRSQISFDVTVRCRFYQLFSFTDHMYVYEGKDYSKEPSREDKKAFDQLLDLQKSLIEETSKEGRALRNKANVRLKTWQDT